MRNFSPYPIGDLRLRVDVQERLQRAPELAGAQLRIDVADGEVSLTGKVASRLQIDSLLALVSSVSGVEQIHENLHTG